MQRRDFLKLTGRSTLFLAFAGCANTKNLRALGDLPRPKSKVSELNLEGAFPVSSGQLLFPSFDNPRSVLGKEYPDTGNSFFNLSFSKRKLQGISTPLKLSHAAFQFPTEHHRVIILEKDGGLACTINLREMQVEKIVPAKKDWNFNGHGVFSADQKYFYTTEYWKSEKNIGAIVVRDGRTFEILGEMNSGGIQPHDLKFFDSEKKMAVAHYGKTPGNTRANLGASITFLEIVSGKVLQTVDAPGGNQELCHISISNNNKYLHLTIHNQDLKHSLTNEMIVPEYLL